MPCYTRPVNHSIPTLTSFPWTEILDKFKLFSIEYIHSKWMCIEKQNPKQKQVTEDFKINESAIQRFYS